jgi:pyruvate kinase
LQGVDWIALSFVRKPEDVQELRKLIGDPGIKVIAKIEKPEAVANMDAIIAEVDGIMVARGDLGIEMPAEKVPVIQKELIAKCRLAGKARHRCNTNARFNDQESACHASRNFRYRQRCH